jgi:hypothetical protein
MSTESEPIAPLNYRDDGSYYSNEAADSSTTSRSPPVARAERNGRRSSSRKPRNRQRRLPLASRGWALRNGCEARPRTLVRLRLNCS